MILSYQIPEFEAYRTAALALYDVERDIASKQRSRHAIDAKILPRLIEKRARLLVEVEPLKARAEAAERAAWERMKVPTPSLHSVRPTTPRCNSGEDGLDIPAFLRRER